MGYSHVMQVFGYLKMWLSSIIHFLYCSALLSAVAAAGASSSIAVALTPTTLVSEVSPPTSTHISTSTTRVSSERFLTPTLTPELHPQNEPSKLLVKTIALSAAGIVIVSTIVFVITAAVVACVKKKGKYTIDGVRYEASESMIMNPGYHGWSTQPRAPSSSIAETSMIVNAINEPNLLRVPVTANRSTSIAASERLYASIHQRTILRNVYSVGAPVSNTDDDIVTKTNEAYHAAADSEPSIATTPSPHSQPANSDYDYVVLQDT